MGNLKDFENEVFRTTFVNFVETGCYRGDGLRVGSRYSRFMYSCDITKQYVDRCSAMFPNAVIKCIDSFGFLMGLLHDLSGRTFFWLDAHYPNQYNKMVMDTEANRYPLLSELHIIRSLKSNYHLDTIVCDDLRVLQSDDNPVRCNVGEHNLKDHHPVHGVTFNDVVGPFSSTHEYRFVGIDTLVLLPKNNKG